MACVWGFFLFGFFTPPVYQNKPSGCVAQSPGHPCLESELIFETERCAVFVRFTLRAKSELGVT